MNRNTIINSVVAAAIVALVVVVLLVEGGDNDSARSTTTAAPTSQPTTVPPTTAPPASTTTSTVAPTTVAPTTVPPTTAPPTTVPPATAPPTTEAPLPRGLWKVIVVNGSTSGERLQPMIDELEQFGYVGVRGLVGAVRTTETVIYYAFPGQENAADRLRADLGLTDVSIAVFDEAPPVAGRNDAELMVYLGGR